MNITIREIEYPVDEGAVVIKNYNEELDSATIRISNLTSKIELEPFDRVYLDDKLMDINTWECTMNGYLGDATYTYDITLFSPTKELENVILPNLSITPRKIGTKLTIAQHIARYVNLYMPNLELENSRIFGKFNKYTPELQWNEPTLREVLTTLMMTMDCIPIINNDGKLDYLDLTETGDEITGYNYIKTSQSADNYVSELRMNMQNVLQEDSVVTTSEYIAFTSEDSILTSDNIILKTQFPILNIKHLWCFIEFYNDNAYDVGYDLGSVIAKADLCNIDLLFKPNHAGSLVKEKKEYDILNSRYRRAAIGERGYGISDFYSKFQEYCIWYERGNNIIDGFTVLRKGHSILSSKKQTLEWIKFLTAGTQVPSTFSTSDLDSLYDSINQSGTHLNTYFKIEYETLASQVFQASKSDKVGHKRVAADNQTNSWVNATTQGNLEYQKANRLGNEITLINKRIDANGTGIELGDTYQDNIVYRIERQYNSDYTNINAYATKNYILRDYWTGVNSKIRTWVNAQDEAFIRDELKKYYCEFSYTPQESIISAEPFVKALDNERTSELLPIQYVGINTRQFDDSYLPTNDKCYLLNCVSRPVGKSMLFTFGFNDNHSVGKNQRVYDVDDETKLVDITTSSTKNLLFTFEDSQEVGGGMPLKYLEYVDDDFEFRDIYFDFATGTYMAYDKENQVKISEADLIGEWQQLEENQTKTNVKEFMYATWKKPLADKELIEDFVVFSDNMNIYKDNKEIPRITTQFEFLSDTNNIVVFNRFVELQGWLKGTAGTDYDVYLAQNWNFRSNELPSEANKLQGVGLEIDYTANNSAKISITYPRAWWYFIVEKDTQNILLAFKGKPNLQEKTTFYLNILGERNG